MDDKAGTSCGGPNQNGGEKEYKCSNELGKFKLLEPQNV